LRYIQIVGKQALRAIVVVVWPLLVCGQNLKEFEKRVTEFTLPNGLHFLVCERHEAPVVSFHTYVNAGSVDDPEGQTGIAHMFEHMAFKGTETIGTRNWPEEKKALDEVDRIYAQLEMERRKGVSADAQKIAKFETEAQAAIEKAQTYVIPNQYTSIIEENGGVGMNASTGLDSTEYFYSLPANRLELWFLLESQRFLQPVFREFYKERDVVLEEYRMRVESSPQGKLIETFLATAFAAHPYRRMSSGWPSDIALLRRDEAERFFRTYYVPENLTIAIVGDVNPATARAFAEKYFGPLPRRPLPPIITTVEPRQQGPKNAQVETPSEPVLVVGYKRPDQYDKDDPVFDVISGVLASGRTGTLYREMVRDKQVSLTAAAASEFPGGKYANLFLFFFMPGMEHSVEENSKIFYDILERFKTEKVDAETLARVKTKVRAGLIRQLDNNPGLANLLAAYHANYGNWRKLFTSLDEIDKVTAEDVQRVARTYFTDNAKTVSFTFQPAAKSGGAH
jgi:predicted Zn-dependent peptidase